MRPSIRIIVVQYNAKHYNTIQYNTIQHNTIQNNTTQYKTIQYNTIQYKTIQYNIIQYNTIQYNTIQYNTIQYNTIQYNTIQYKVYSNFNEENEIRIATGTPEKCDKCNETNLGGFPSFSISNFQLGRNVWNDHFPRPMGTTWKPLLRYRNINWD